jgi:hypothetical protein
VRHLVPGLGARAPRDAPDRPAPITAADPNSFAWTVLHRRLPRAAELARNANPYLPEQADALDRLAAEVNGTVAPLVDDGPDTAGWRDWAKGNVGRPWAEVPLLWAEAFFHRRLLAAVGFFAPGPWHWLDPFAHLKTAGHRARRGVPGGRQRRPRAAGRPGAGRRAAGVRAGR